MPAEITERKLRGLSDGNLDRECLGTLALGHAQMFPKCSHECKSGWAGLGRGSGKLDDLWDFSIGAGGRDWPISLNERPESRRFPEEINKSHQVSTPLHPPLFLTVFLTVFALRFLAGFSESSAPVGDRSKRCHRVHFTFRNCLLTFGQISSPSVKSAISGHFQQILTAAS